jgi:hypothetical protein
MMFKSLTYSLFVAICRSNWLYSRKYRTVGYHPASSRFYLTVFILCQFLGKLTGMLPDFDARAMCVKPANLACCVLGVRCWFYVNRAESWVAIGGGYTEFAGFAVVHQKTTGLLGWATKPRPKTRWGGVATQAGLTAQEGRSDRLG